MKNLTKEGKKEKQIGDRVKAQRQQKEKRKKKQKIKNIVLK